MDTCNNAIKYLLHSSDRKVSCITYTH
jgi:hypothetical protein